MLVVLWFVGVFALGCVVIYGLEKGGSPETFKKAYAVILLACCMIGALMPVFDGDFSLVAIVKHGLTYGVGAILLSSFAAAM